MVDLYANLETLPTKTKKSQPITPEFYIQFIGEKKQKHRN